jgi:hypothetical protein
MILVQADTGHPVMVEGAVQNDEGSVTAFEVQVLDWDGTLLN